MSDSLIKLLAFILVALFLVLAIKPKNAEFAFFIGFAASAVVAVYMFSHLKSGIDEARAALDDFGVETKYFSLALKSVGLGYITSFVSDACKDAGQISLASKAELLGKAAIFLLCLPMISSILKIAVGFING